MGKKKASVPSNREEMLKRWQERLHRRDSTPEDWEELRLQLLRVAEENQWIDWSRYLEAREGYGKAPWNIAQERLQGFITWAEMSEVRIEPWLLTSAKFCVCVCRYEQGAIFQASNCFEKVIEECREGDSPEHADMLARALYNVIFTKFTSGNKKSANQYVDELRELAEVDQNNGAYRELSNVLMLFASDEESDQEVVSSNLCELNEIAQKSNDPVVIENLASATLNAYNNASEDGYEAIADRLLGELRSIDKTYPDPSVREKLASALFNRFSTASALGDQSAADIALEELRSLAREFGEPALMERLAKALIRQGLEYGKADKQGALRSVREVLELLANSISDDTVQLLAIARRAKNKLSLELGIKDDESQSDILLQQSSTDRLGAESRESYRRIGLLDKLDKVIAKFKPEKERILRRMDDRRLRVERFLQPQSCFNPSASVLLILRQWNSFTPIIADGQESDRGGGYFIYHRGVGLVIDPGYDFIEHFYKSGGRICDITHIAVTHAHDDHTAQLEQLLSLLYQYNEHNKANAKKITLIANHSTLKKFSGFRLYRDCPYIKRIICLNAFDGTNEQAVYLDAARSICVTVLKAYHDDIFTLDYAVGLGIEVYFQDCSRKLVFTGDTGLYPPKLDPDGKKVRFGDGPYDGEVVVAEDEPQLAVHKSYPLVFSQQPDLLVPHMGSIRKYELDPELSENIPMFYPNHLGLLGTATLIMELNPRAIVLSEFGSELRDFRMLIAQSLADALEEQTGKRPFIVPGDNNIVYSIEDGKFLVHEDCRFHDACDVEAKEVDSGEIGLLLRGGSFASLSRYRHSLTDLRGGASEVEVYPLPHML